MAKRVSLSVSLTTEQAAAAFVAEKVGSGRYGSATGADVAELVHGR